MKFTSPPSLTSSASIRKRVAENMIVNPKSNDVSYQKMSNLTNKRRKRPRESKPRKVQFNVPEKESLSHKIANPETSSLQEAVTTTQLKMKFFQRRLERLQLEALLQERQANLKKRLPAVQQEHPSLMSHLQARREFVHEDKQSSHNAAVVDMLMRHKLRREMFRRYACQKLDLFLPRTA
mmetsp:Transcript_2624/g.3828  ORF Transcript_2624/g.3828 Transcript_2624/m.3828 type:complete len:180 (-) Transcript_2624:269-808(-)